jgi:ATP-dependent helicase HrpB
MNEHTWLTMPPAGAQAQAKELLHALNALNENQITLRGKKMLQLPTHPRLAHMLIEAEQFQKNNPEFSFVPLACDLAAILEERDPLPKDSGTDLSLRVELLRKYRMGERVNAERSVLDRIERLSFSWRKLLHAEPDNRLPNAFHIGKLIAAAYPERVAKRIEKNGSRYRLSNGRIAKLGEHDSITADEWIAVAQLDGGMAEGKIFLAAPFNSADLTELAVDKEVIIWDKEKKMITGNVQKQVGNLTLESKAIHQIGESKRIPVICNMIREEGLRILNWSDTQREWQARVMSLRTWRPNDHWPDVSEQHLLDTLEDWLAPYLINVYKLSELQRLDLQQMLNAILPWNLAQKLDTLAPSKIKVPTGSLIKLTYATDGSKVEMAVRLQEVFGLTDTPCINEGKNKIILHLLSPGYKPVQITQDLKSFWSKTYFEVRKDLLSRYPRHHWPDNPLTAEAVRGPKKRQN